MDIVHAAWTFGAVSWWAGIYYRRYPISIEAARRQRLLPPRRI